MYGRCRKCQIKIVVIDKRERRKRITGQKAVKIGAKK